ncbi:sulfotransferase 1E1 [Megalopta genalis]|uniref:sulfotransferase 1E1 n=1 Tax=Megalopta genalis TaxID=115081 RepID=UPI0014432E9F|nr:sulfotransferase 1E1-like [Megalopta genalis]
MARTPPQYKPLDEKKTKEMLKVFAGERTGWVLVGAKKWFFPYRYTEQANGFYNFKARSDDTWVLSYPRSGTTWTQELVWLLSNNLDIERARKQLLAERFPFLEFSMYNHPEVTNEFLEMNKGDRYKEDFCRNIAKPGYERLEKMESPRFIKSHFPFSLLPGILDCGCKIVYVARNPKDVAVSWYHLNKAIKTQGYKGNFPMFWDYFQNNLTPWSPYWEHLKEAWSFKNHPNLLFMFYEEMQHDFPKAIRKVARFLGKVYTEEQIKQLTQYLNIENFKNNPMVNSSELKDCNIITAGTFVRQGQSDGWRDMFDSVLNAKADEWIAENMKGTDFAFPNFNNNVVNNCY